jgi:t-SNARE complex subunit (syntaxin)
MTQNKKTTRSNLEAIQNTLENKDEKIIKVDKQINEVKNIMRDNMEKAFDRNIKLETIEDKSVNMLKQAEMFEKQAASVRRSMCLKKYKVYCIILFVIAIVVTICALSIKYKYDNN